MSRRRNVGFLHLHFVQTLSRSLSSRIFIRPKGPREIRSRVICIVCWCIYFCVFTVSENVLNGFVWGFWGRWLIENGRSLLIFGTLTHGKGPLGAHLTSLCTSLCTSYCLAQSNQIWHLEEWKPIRGSTHWFGASAGLGPVYRCGKYALKWIVML